MVRRFTSTFWQLYFVILLLWLRYVAYNQSEAVVDEAFDDVCAKSEFQGFTEKNEEAKFRLMVGKTITMKSLSGESLKTGQGDTVKNMCHNVIDRHEDDLTKVT